MNRITGIKTLLKTKWLLSDSLQWLRNRYSSTWSRFLDWFNRNQRLGDMCYCSPCTLEYPWTNHLISASLSKGVPDKLNGPQPRVLWYAMLIVMLVHENAFSFSKSWKKLKWICWRQGLATVVSSWYSQVSYFILNTACVDDGAG